MGPKKKANEVDETPPDTPSTTYDVIIYVCLKDAEPFQWLPSDHVFADERKVQDIVGFDPKKKLTLQNRAKINNFLLDETQPPKAMSIFCRVEKGTSKGRVKSLLVDLNARLKSLPYPQKSSLKAMLIKNFGEKMMKDWSYEERDPITNKITYRRWKEISTRSKDVSKLPQTTGDEEDSEEDFQTRSKGKGAKKAIPSSSVVQSAPSAKETSPSGVLLNNPFFTPTPGTSRTMGLSGKDSKKQDKDAGSISKEALNEPQPSTSKAMPPSKVAAKSKDASKRSADKTRKRIVEETSESDSDTITSKMSPAKRMALQKQLAAVEDLPQTSAGPSTASTTGPEIVQQDLPLPPFNEGQQQIVNYDPVTKTYGIAATYTEAIVISEEQLDNKLRSFVTDLERNRAQSDPFKAVVKAAVEEAVEPKFVELRETIKDLIANEIQKVLEALATKATKSSTTRILDAINSTKTTIEDFSIEQARIRCEISNITENAAEKTSRSCGILGRFLPFDYMGVAFDAFLSSHYVQSKIVALLKDDFESRKGSINVRIAFSLTNVLITRLAMAHLVWRHPKNAKKTLYYKRIVPDAFEKIIKTDIIPFVRTSLQLGGETFAGSFEGVRKVMATRFANARTKMLEVAFAEGANPDAAIDALHNVDNEFYVHNVHAIPNTVEMDDKAEYRSKLRKDRAECGTGEDREASGKPFKSEDVLFDTLRHGNTSKQVFSVYEVMQGIIAAAKADGLDVTKLTFDQPRNVPDLKSIYKKVLNDHISDMEALMNKFPIDVEASARRTRSDSESDEEEQLKNVSMASLNESSDQGEDEEQASPRDKGSDEEGEAESPSEFDRNVETVTLSSDEDQRCYSQKPSKDLPPPPQSKDLPPPPPQSKDVPPPSQSQSTLQGVNRFGTPIVVHGISTENLHVQTTDTDCIPSASTSHQSTSSYQTRGSQKSAPVKVIASAYDEHGRPQPLPPLPDDPYALPNRFANIPPEELQARLLEAHKKMVEKYAREQAEKDARK